MARGYHANELSEEQKERALADYLALPRGPSGRVKNGCVEPVARRWGKTVGCFVSMCRLMERKRGGQNA